MNRRMVNGALLGVPEAAAYLGGSERWLRRFLDRLACNQPTGKTRGHGRRR
jgi:hypothetical protein